MNDDLRQHMWNLNAGSAAQGRGRRRGTTTPAHLLRVYNGMDSTRKTRTLKIVEEPCPEQRAERVELEPV